MQYPKLSISEKKKIMILINNKLLNIIKYVLYLDDLEKLIDFTTINKLVNILDNLKEKKNVLK